VKRVSSDALSSVNDALGLTGRGSANTEMTDGTLDQVLDVGPLIRRGRTPAATGGLFHCAFENVHAGAGDIANFIDPYEPGALGVEPYGPSVPRWFDLWVIGVNANRRSGTGTIAGSFVFDFGNAGWGRDDSGVFVDPLNQGSQSLMIWNQVFSAGGLDILTNNASVAINPGGVRIPRSPGVFLGFLTTASALSTYTAQCTIGLFPNGLGQDGIT